jgi:carbon-monoxide dehydrogenase medium subunit
MKPPAFAYHAPTTVAEVLGLLRAHGPEAKILAGGQSLLAMMKLRLARPPMLIDLNRVRELEYVREGDGVLAFGALTRLYQLESDLVRRACPILAEAARHIAHPAIRNRGTVCGSLAHADPAAELPVLALALDAELGALGPRGARRLPARDFFVTYLTTALEPDELLVEARFPRLRPGAGWAFAELSRRAGDFALVAVAAVLERGPGGTVTEARIALGAVAERPVRCPEAEASLRGRPGGIAAFREAAAAAAQPLDPPADVHGSAAYRKQVARVLVERALTRAWDRAGAPAGGAASAGAR